MPGLSGTASCSNFYLGRFKAAAGNPGVAGVRGAIPAHSGPMLNKQVDGSEPGRRASRNGSGELSARYTKVS